MALGGANGRQDKGLVYLVARLEDRVRLQSSQNSCGFATAGNALRAIGRRVTEDQVHAKVKLGQDGVDEATCLGATEVQIIKGLRAFRVEVTQLQVHSELAAV